MRFGVLALQGDFAVHEEALRSCGHEPSRVSKAEQLSELAGLIIPGGESTTLMKLMSRCGLDEALRGSSTPVMGTCAGAILLAREVDGGEGLGLMDVSVKRNAYGRQIDSFTADVDVPAEGRTVSGVFIRAPAITRVGKGVSVLAALDGDPVAVASKRCLALTFHPELVGEGLFYEKFAELCGG